MHWGSPRLAHGPFKGLRQSRWVAGAPLSPAILFLAAVFNLPAVQAKSLHPDSQLLRGEVQRYGDWLVGCDNSAMCTMIGFPDDGPRHAGSSPMGIEIGLSGPAGSDPIVQLLPIAATAKGAESDLPARPFTLDLEVERGIALSVHGFSRSRLTGEEAAALVERLASGRPVLGQAAGCERTVAHFPHKDFARGIRAMLKRRQHLLEQLEHNVFVSGELPDGNDMPSPVPLRRIAAIPALVSGFVPIATDNTCPNSRTQNLKRFTFPGDTELWSYECAEGSAAGKTFLAMSKGLASRAIPLDLPEPRLGKISAGQDGLNTSGVHFDWDFGVLRQYLFQQGREDCGLFRVWGYTSQGWYLSERREMPICKGLGPADWLRTYSMPLAGVTLDD